MGLCRSTNRQFGAFSNGSLSQYKPAVRCLYKWVSVAVQSGGSVPFQMGLCRSTKWRFSAFSNGSLSQYKVEVRCLFKWVSVAVQTVQLPFCPSTHLRLVAFAVGYLSQFTRTIKCLSIWLPVPINTISSMPLQFSLCPYTNRGQPRVSPNMPDWGSRTGFAGCCQ